MISTILPEEEWRPVVGYEGLYSVSSLGRVRSEDRIIECSNGVSRRHPRRILKSHQNLDGYFLLRLYRDGDGITVKVHRLVLEAFVGPCPERTECRHLDGNPGHNWRENLRWGTRKENCKDTIQHGRSNSGEKQRNAKLTETDVRFIRHWLKKGYIQKRIAGVFGVTPQTISHINTGRIWGWMKT